MSYRRVKSYEPMHQLMLRFLKNITTFLFFFLTEHVFIFSSKIMKIHENPILERFASYLGENQGKFEIFKSKKKKYTKKLFSKLMMQSEQCGHWLSIALLVMKKY